MFAGLQLKNTVLNNLDTFLVYKTGHIGIIITLYITIDSMYINMCIALYIKLECTLLCI